MRTNFSVLLIAVLAFGWSSLASAEDPTSDDLEAKIKSTMSELSLDSVFERVTAPKTTYAFQSLTTGTSTMRCRSAAADVGTETCVVTARADMVASVPAALSRR